MVLDELHRRMRTFKGPRDPMHASMIRLIDLLSKVDGKLSKTEMRNLMLPMKMNLQDQEAVLNKVYSEYHNICKHLDL